MKHHLLLSMVLVATVGLLQAAPPDWKITTGHINAMVIYATVVDASGKPMNSPGSLLSASEYGILAGSTPISNGPKGPVFQMKVGSENWQSDLTYSFYDGKTDRVIDIGPGPGFVSGSIVGTIVQPAVLKLNQ
jgi:hypothetical protein